MGVCACFTSKLQSSSAGQEEEDQAICAYTSAICFYECAAAGPAVCAGL